ncbi:MAG TPA: hypothetical protein VEJ18_14930 [Planctomycetota bacterium]|nr:hypothetical protein [Planctomycetota bacterium]
MDDRTSRPGPGASVPDPGEVVAGVRLTPSERPLFGFSKSDLARYFERASAWILAHAGDRPLAIVRCARGSEACQVQRHATADLPSLIHRAQIPEGTRTRTVFSVDSTQGLVALAQIGCVELRPWNARVSELGTPDRMIFGVEPARGIPWGRTVEAAKELRAVLESRGLRSFAKLSGARGIHVLVPLSPEHGWEEVRGFARRIAEGLARRRPSRYAARRTKGRILIHVAGNAQGGTAVAAYSPRARRGLPVSMPVSWEELTPDLPPDAFPVPEALERLQRIPEDPWTGFHRLAQTLPQDGPIPGRGDESQA